jgi:hypothetical protein
MHALGLQSDEIAALVDILEGLRNRNEKKSWTLHSKLEALWASPLKVKALEIKVRHTFMANSWNLFMFCSISWILNFTVEISLLIVVLSSRTQPAGGPLSFS